MSDLRSLLLVQVDKALEALDPCLRELVERTVADCETAIVTVNQEFDEAALFFDKKITELAAEVERLRAEAPSPDCERCARLELDNHRLNCEVDRLAFMAACPSADVAVDMVDEGEAARALMKAAATEVDPQVLPFMRLCSRSTCGNEATELDTDGSDLCRGCYDLTVATRAASASGQASGTPPPVAPSGREAKEAAVLDAVREGCNTQQLLMERLGLSQTSISIACRSLIEDARLIVSRAHKLGERGPTEYGIPEPPAPPTPEPVVVIAVTEDDQDEAERELVQCFGRGGAMPDTKAEGPWPDIDPNAIPAPVRAAVSSIQGGLRRGVPIH